MRVFAVILVFLTAVGAGRAETNALTLNQLVMEIETVAPETLSDIGFKLNEKVELENGEPLGFLKALRPARGSWLARRIAEIRKLHRTDKAEAEKQITQLKTQLQQMGMEF